MEACRHQLKDVKAGQIYHEVEKNNYQVSVFENLSPDYSRLLVVIVQSAECGVRSAECGVRSAECGVRSAECGVRSAHCTHLIGVDN